MSAINRVDQRAFTIVELLIVVVVIAILAAISVVAYTNIQSRAKDSANLSHAESISRAINLYKVDNSDNPPICPAGNGQGCVFVEIQSQLVPKYMTQLPNDANPAYPYYYVGVTAASGGSWSVRMQKYTTGSPCKFGDYPSSLDLWWSYAPRC